MSGKYDDIIGMPRHVSVSRRPMAMENRAAQFAPFAALTGHEDAIAETARLTSRPVELSDDELNRLARRMNILMKKGNGHPTLDITFFLPDRRKEGGRYITVTGTVKTVDEIAHTLILTDNTEIPLAAIAAIAQPG